MELTPISFDEEMKNWLFIFPLNGSRRLVIMVKLRTLMHNFHQ